MKDSFRSVAQAALLGVGVLFISTIVAFFASSGGVRTNTDAWPASAKAILTESPSAPITAEQWKRIEKALSADSNNAKSGHLFAAEVRNTWYVFVALSAFGLLLAHHLWKPLSLSIAGAMVAPTALALLAAFQHVHPYYR
jgi:hypothetical protein